MGGKPEPGEAERPESREDAELVIPGVDGGQVQHGEADPQARIAVAAGPANQSYHHPPAGRRGWLGPAPPHKRPPPGRAPPAKNTPGQRPAKTLPPPTPPSPPPSPPQ